MKTYAQFPARYLSLVTSNPGSMLLQTSRFDDENYRSYLFTQPVRTLSISNGLFDEIDQALASGAYVAGYLAYECGESLQKIDHCGRQNTKLPPGWFGVYSKTCVFDHRTGEFEGDAPDDFPAEDPKPGESFAIQNLRLGIDEKSYAQKIAAIQEYIRAGDTYQVNFTDQARFDFSGSAMALFAALVESQPVQYSAFLHGENSNT